MATNPPNDSYGLSETFATWDFFVGLLAAAGAGYDAYWHPSRLDGLTTVAAAVTTVVVGTAIAGTAIQAALMSDAFLRRVRQIPREPTYYLRHWVFSVTLGVVAALACGLLAGLPDTAPTWLRVSAASAACGLAAWVLASVVSAVLSLNSFVQLRADAAELEDQ